MPRGYTTVTVNYEEVAQPVRRAGRCPVCQRKVTRSCTFTNTISPFNKNPETGLPRTRAEVQAHLTELARDWAPDFTHAACREDTP